MWSRHWRRCALIWCASIRDCSRSWGWLRHTFPMCKFTLIPEVEAQKGTVEPWGLPYGDEDGGRATRRGTSETRGVTLSNFLKAKGTEALY